MVEDFGGEEIEKKLARVSNRLNEYRFDPWGFSPESAQFGFKFFNWLYTYYWRTQTYNIERVPSGRVLLIANHSGQIPIDGTMLAIAMLKEANPPRVARGMVERWFTTLPLIGTMITRHGSVVGDPRNCVRLLQNEDTIMVFPEGIRGSGKLWKDRYKLMEFGLGFMRLALETDTPIVPVGIIGGEEQAPSFADVRFLAKFFNLPYFPITPIWPWLGVLGMIPFPTKYRMYFGEPMRFRGRAHDRDAVIESKVAKVRQALRKLIDRGLAERESIFW
ncbi:MAG: acyltransferase family protein [Acidobacteria bacterium]|nr:acyltransferase family protein [Acidobacteriota bacterium]MBI3658667.1 acyltransferase family protein [Acidobacteriota bacterium]